MEEGCFKFSCEDLRKLRCEFVGSFKSCLLSDEEDGIGIK